MMTILARHDMALAAATLTDDEIAAVAGGQVFVGGGPYPKTTDGPVDPRPGWLRLHPQTEPPVPPGGRVP